MKTTIFRKIFILIALFLAFGLNNSFAENRSIDEIKSEIEVLKEEKHIFYENNKNLLQELNDESLSKLAEFDDKIIELDIEIAKKEGRVEYLGNKKYETRCFACNNYKWYNGLDTGDILLFYRKNPIEGWENKPGVGGWYHAALVYDNNYVFEAPGTGYKSKYTKIEDLINKGGYDKIAVAKMKLSHDEKLDMKSYVPRLLNKPYTFNYNDSKIDFYKFLTKKDKESMDKFYCSSLVWRAHFSSGRYMDIDGDDYPPFYGVLPREILVDNNVRGNLSYIIN